MSAVAVRDLRNETRKVLERVRSGEVVTITVDGLPMAELRPLAERPRFVDRQTFAALIVSKQADPALADDLAELTPDTTDDLPW